jgi:hypothetical protein
VSSWKAALFLTLENHLTGLVILSIKKEIWMEEGGWEEAISPPDRERHNIPKKANRK